MTATISVEHTNSYFMGTFSQYLLRCPTNQHITGSCLDLIHILFRPFGEQILIHSKYPLIQWRGEVVLRRRDLYTDQRDASRHLIG